MRHESIRNFEANLLQKICNDVELEPILQPLEGEKFKLKINAADDARLDIRARGLLRKGQSAYFDLRVTNTNSPSQVDQSSAKIFRRHEQDKKRQYNSRVMNVEQGTFTPLVFAVNGGVGPECEVFHKFVADKIAMKTGERYEQVVAWIRCKLSIIVMRSALLCLRGTRATVAKELVSATEDINMACHELGIKY